MNLKKENWIERIAEGGEWNSEGDYQFKPGETIYVSPDSITELSQAEWDECETDKDVRLYMNTVTRSVDVREGWWYPNDEGETVNAVDLGEVVEVKKAENGDWIEVD